MDKTDSIDRKKGWFITIEGPEGAGKSSCAGVLVKFFESRQMPVICTREPGGTPLAEKLREVVKNKPDANETIHPETELLLMEAARAQHVREKIIPALEQGISVICDRFTDSTSAYQGGGRKMDMNNISALNDFASGSCRPDLTILLDLPVEIGLSRAQVRAAGKENYNDRLEAEKIDFHQRVRNSYLAIAAREPQRVKVLDARLGIEELFAQLKKQVDDALSEV